MESPVVTFKLINEQLNDIDISLVYDYDLNAYKGGICTTNFKFPLLVNLSKIQHLNTKGNQQYELMFLCNERNLIKLFLYEKQQRMYCDKYNCIRLNEHMIYDLLYKNNCDEAILFFDGTNFEFMYQNDGKENWFYKHLYSIFTSLPAKLLYAFFFSFKVHTLLSTIHDFVDGYMSS